MAAITGRWTLIDVTNGEAFGNAIKCTDEYKAKFYEYAEGLKTGKVKYEEEFILDRAAGTVQCFVIVNGQRIKDHGVMKVGVVNDHVFDDGRPTKLKIIIDSDSKFRGWETFDDFTLNYTVEATADRLTVTNEKEGLATVWTFRRS